MKNTFVKIQNNMFSPAYEPDIVAASKVKIGSYVNMEWSKMRNPKFHAKGFSLFTFAFDYWKPVIADGATKWAGVEPSKNFDRFRKDLTILAGFYECHHRLDGTFRIEAKSLSFASMEEDEFEKVYNAIIDVILKKVLVDMEKEELDRTVNQLIGFM